jgi:hypothetical protein
MCKISSGGWELIGQQVTAALEEKQAMLGFRQSYEHKIY